MLCDSLTNPHILHGTDLIYHNKSQLLQFIHFSFTPASCICDRLAGLCERNIKQQAHSRSSCPESHTQWLSKVFTPLYSYVVPLNHKHKYVSFEFNLKEQHKVN